VLINDGTAARNVAVRVPGRGTATLARLQAPGILATGGVTLGGRSFGASTSTGLIGGQPATSSVSPTGGLYVVTLPAASAALLEFS
jgi:hypothetical protein